LHPKWLLLLRVVLIVRCVLDVVFAWRIQRMPNSSIIDLADAFAPFALFDGIAGSAIAGVGFAAALPRGVVGLAAADAMLRLAAANALHFGPGISYFPMTIVLYVGLLAAFALAFGIAETIEAWELEHEAGRKPLSIALGFAGVATVALAVTQFALLHVPSAFKNLLTIGISLQALTMLAVAGGAQKGSVEGLPPSRTGKSD
jgi:hypothetical protein